jgi:hypothetical protein
MPTLVRLLQRWPAAVVVLAAAMVVLVCGDARRKGRVGDQTSNPADARVVVFALAGECLRWRVSVRAIRHCACVSSLRSRWRRRCSVAGEQP